MLVACQDQVRADSNGKNPILRLFHVSRSRELDGSRPTLHYEDLDVETIKTAKCLHAKLANIVTSKIYRRGRHKVDGHPEIAYCQSPWLILANTKTMLDEY